VVCLIFGPVLLLARHELARSELIATSKIEGCLQQAAAFHHVAYPVLRAIAKHESGFRSDLVSKPNADGSVDMGLMQINTHWLKHLSQWGISRSSLFDPCVNAYVGAWILSQNFNKLGVNWNAVGAYNATSHQKRYAYAVQIYNELTAHPAAHWPQTATTRAMPSLGGGQPASIYAEWGDQP
jgi:Transglycosylase SLT domain